jgi:hypothetical protein
MLPVRKASENQTGLPQREVRASNAVSQTASLSRDISGLWPAFAEPCIFDVQPSSNPRSTRYAGLPNPKRSRRERCGLPDAQVPAGRRDLPRCDAVWPRWSGRAPNQRVNHLGPRGRFISSGVLKHCHAHGGGRFKSAWVLKLRSPPGPDGNMNSNGRLLRVVAATEYIDCSLPTCKPRRSRKREWSQARNGFAFSFLRPFVDLRASCAGRLVQAPCPFDRILPQHVA